MLAQRRHIRKRDCDYSSPNAYFITICVYGKVCSLGTIVSDIVEYSDIGNMAFVYLQDIPLQRKHVLLDEFIIMPNHIHCILQINKRNEKSKINMFSAPVNDSISMIINHFKGRVKKWCNNNGHLDFEWQGRFYDHIIRNRDEYYAIKNYIINNPKNWHKDRLHP